MSYFVEVILPLPLKKTFTYKVNEAEYQFIRPGMRIAVPFGKSKIYTGVAKLLHQQSPQAYEAKDIHQILDENPIVTEEQLQIWEWIANYYMCSIGEVFKASLPGILSLESETQITAANQNIDLKDIDLNDEEYLILEALKSHSSINIHEAADIIDSKKALPVVQKLMSKNLVKLHEQIHEVYKPKEVKYIRLKSEYNNPASLENLILTLQKRPKQLQVILSLFALSSNTKNVIPSVLMEKAEVGNSVLKGLVDKGILEYYNQIEDRIAKVSKESYSYQLSEQQLRAKDEIVQAFEHTATVLLHGVTSSGKTEIYMQLMLDEINKGNTVLFLVPEIALTTQLLQRLQHFFGNRVISYHSKNNQNERVEAWYKILNQNEHAQIIVSARSGVLLPFRKLGLIIVDEEHEASYKQQDPAPRYHARDVAIVLSKLHHAKTLLGSATPSIESYYNCQVKKYNLVELNERYSNFAPPEISLIDLKKNYAQKKTIGHFSYELINLIKETLARKEQIILFQNRRGYAPVLECEECGHISKCSNCDVSLTFHQQRNQLRCHYCAYSIPKSTHCVACSSTHLSTKGFGTEQITEEVMKLFPEAKIARMDQDTTRGKFAYEKLIEKFENQEIDILVGTQMIAKGLDFANVTLVGILNADSLLNYPDFRAKERSFQMLTQVAGRAGRSGKESKVVIQTYSPNSEILNHVISYNYLGMFLEEHKDRRTFAYPPYQRLIQITLKNKDFQTVEQSAQWLCAVLKQNSKAQVLGPEIPVVSKVRGLFIRQILLKIDGNENLSNTKKTIQRILDSFDAIGQFKSVQITLNVDVY